MANAISNGSREKGSVQIEKKQDIDDNSVKSHKISTDKKVPHMDNKQTGKSWNDNPENVPLRLLSTKVKDCVLQTKQKVRHSLT